MTIQIFNIRITIFKVEKLERANLSFDNASAKRQAEEIKNSESFASIKEQARLIRESRNK